MPIREELIARIQMQIRVHKQLKTEIEAETNGMKLPTLFVQQKIDMLEDLLK